MFGLETNERRKKKCVRKYKKTKRQTKNTNKHKINTKRISNLDDLFSNLKIFVGSCPLILYTSLTVRRLHI